MTLRSGHGTGRGAPRVEVLPPDEQPAPVPAPAAAPTAPLAFREDGTIADSATAKHLGSIGGRRRAAKVRLVDSLGLSKLVEGSAFGPYRSAADEFVRHHLAVLATQAGGEVGPAPSTMVASAALQLAASRWAFDQGAEKSDPALMKLGSQLANDSRQNLLAAYELAVREAKARPRSPDDLERRLLGPHLARRAQERADEEQEAGGREGSDPAGEPEAIPSDVEPLAAGAEEPS